MITVEVLAEIERTLRKMYGRGDDFVLADYFDYIAGTSTGAIIAAGLALGIGGALALTRFISSELWEVQATDPATFAGVSILLVTVAVAACLIPTRRAVQIDPTIALRYE